MDLCSGGTARRSGMEVMAALDTAALHQKASFALGHETALLGLILEAVLGGSGKRIWGSYSYSVQYM